MLLLLLSANIDICTNLSYTQSFSMFLSQVSTESRGGGFENVIGNDTKENVSEYIVYN